MSPQQFKERHVRLQARTVKIRQDPTASQSGKGRIDGACAGARWSVRGEADPATIDSLPEDREDNADAQIARASGLAGSDGRKKARLRR